jgi:hypothetical protein
MATIANRNKEELIAKLERVRDERTTQEAKDFFNEMIGKVRAGVARVEKR